MGETSFFGTVLFRSGNREISAGFSDVAGEFVPRGDWDLDCETSWETRTGERMGTAERVGEPSEISRFPLLGEVARNPGHTPKHREMQARYSVVTA